MKGIQLATMTIILVILGLIVFLVFGYLIGGGKAQVDIVSAKEALRNCCGDRSIYNCADYSAVYCRVPWSDQSLSMSELMIRANVTDAQITDFCFCS